MKPRALAILLPAAAAVAIACSSGSHPGALGSCTGFDGGGCAPGGSGGSGSGGDGGSAEAASCVAAAGARQCDQCAASLCCTQYAACVQGPACTSVLTCVAESCGDSANCVNACKNEYPAGAPAYGTLALCLQRSCPICAQSGVGDPCGVGQSCVPGLMCTGAWCTKFCAGTPDCVGIGPGGGNAYGQLSECMRAGGGNECVPGCAGGGFECAVFRGTSCQVMTSVEGTLVSVCAPVPDAGRD